MAAKTVWAKSVLDVPSRSRILAGNKFPRGQLQQDPKHLPCFKTFGSFPNMDKQRAGVLRGLPFLPLLRAPTDPMLAMIMTVPEIRRVNVDTVRFYSSKPTPDPYRHLLQGASGKGQGISFGIARIEESGHTRNEKEGKKNSIEVDSLVLLGGLGVTLLGVLLWLYALSESSETRKRATMVTLQETIYNVLEATKDDFHIKPEYVSRTLDDVKGIDDTKRKMYSIVKFLRNPKKTNFKGVLLTGAPGSGKTLLGKAVAGEAKVPFIYLRGSELERSFPRLAVPRIRMTFETAKANAPCVLFIDQIDLLGCKGEAPDQEISTSVRDQLVAEFDGIGNHKGVMVMASTSHSRRSYVDEVFLQRGRLDGEVRVLSPDVKGRKEIIQKSLWRMKVFCDVSIEEIAERTLGFTGAELKNMINQAVIRAAFEGAGSVGIKHLDFGMQKTVEGFHESGRQFGILSKETKLAAAYHHAGIALVMLCTRHAPELERVSIIPRDGEPMGRISFRTPVKTEGPTRAELMATMDASLGGIAAGEVVFGVEEAISMTTNMENADRAAITLVLSPGRVKWGSVTILNDQESGEVKRLLRESYNRAKQILQRYSRQHKALAAALLRHETLNAQQVKSIIMQCN